MSKIAGFVAFIAGLGVFGSPAVIFGQDANSAPPIRKQIAEPKPDDFRMPLKEFLKSAKPSPKNKTSVTNNGVEMTIEVEPEEVKDSTDILIKWEMRYNGPRSPLIIVQPSLTLTSRTLTVLDRATWISVAVVPAEREHVWSAFLASPDEDPIRQVVTDAYSEEKALPPRADNIGPLPDFKYVTLSRERFIEVPLGGMGKGTMRISGIRLKKLLKKNTEELEVNRAPQVYLNVQHGPKDRGEELRLDAWTGELTTEFLTVPMFKKW